MEMLQVYSLVRRETDTLSLHRLVQAVQQAALTEEEQRLWAERTVLLLSAAFPTPPPMTWERCQLLVPHALLCAGYIEHWGFAFPGAESLLHHAGRYLYERAAYEQAVPLLQQVLTLREQTLGPIHADVALSLNDLGDLFLAQGQHTEALPLYQRALVIKEQVLGPHHPEVAWNLSGLAELYRAQGQYTEALSLYQRALTIREHALGPAPPDVALILDSLARLYEEQGRLDEALPLVQRALTIWQHALPDHPNTTTAQEHVVALLHRIESTAAASVEGPTGVNGTSSAQDELPASESSRPR